MKDILNDVYSNVSNNVLKYIFNDVSNVVHIDFLSVGLNDVLSNVYSNVSNLKKQTFCVIKKSLLKKHLTLYLSIDAHGKGRTQDPPPPLLANKIKNLLIKNAIKPKIGDPKVILSQSP